MIRGIDKSIDGLGEAVEIEEDKVCGWNSRASSTMYSHNREPSQTGHQKWLSVYGGFRMSSRNSWICSKMGRPLIILNQETHTKSYKRLCMI
jgi:hypothetical protein